MNRLQEIEARLAAIANEIEQRGAELTAEQLTAFETEVNNLKTERAGLMAAAETYAQELGLAFQIRDDMLDVVGDQQVFGKPIGSDKEEGKITYVDVDGLEGCARAVESCTQKAKDAVAHWPEHDFLFALADQLVDRKK